MLVAVKPMWKPNAFCSVPSRKRIRCYQVLDSVSSASDLAKLETIYELTLDALKATANQRRHTDIVLLADCCRLLQIVAGCGLAHQ